MKRNKRTVSEKRKRKSTAGYIAGGGKSKYALKMREQANGKFRRTSPFRSA